MRPADIALFDFPRAVPAATYERVADALARRLGTEPDVVAVYQLGSVSSPGISDLDMLVVFAEGGGSRLRPRAIMDADAQYLFVHGIFAVSENRLAEALRYTPFGGLRLRWGRELRTDATAPAANPPESVRAQIAAEYLLANYVARVVEARYGIASVRGILLWGNALRYDLELLDVRGGALRGLLDELRGWRATWFERAVKTVEVRRWFGRLLPALQDLLGAVLTAWPLRVPATNASAYARHIRIQQAAALGWRHRGWVWPRRLTCVDRRFVRLQHRLNRFEFGVPCAALEPGSPLARRSEFLDQLIVEQQRMYRGFSPFVTGWHARLRRNLVNGRAA